MKKDRDFEDRAEFVRGKDKTKNIKHYKEILAAEEADEMLENFDLNNQYDLDPLNDSESL